MGNIVEVRACCLPGASEEEHFGGRVEVFVAFDVGCDLGWGGVRP